MKFQKTVFLWPQLQEHEHEIHVHKIKFKEISLFILFAGQQPKSSLRCLVIEVPRSHTHNL
jgi:hypothetical protein